MSLLMKCHQSFHGNKSTLLIQMIKRNFHFHFLNCSKNLFFFGFFFSRLFIVRQRDFRHETCVTVLSRSSDYRHEKLSGQEPISRSEQLPCARVTAFSRTSLFLERFWRESWTSFKFLKPVSKTYRPKKDIFCLLVTFSFPFWYFILWMRS